MSGAMSALEARYLPNSTIPIGAALTFHILLLVWNPTLLTPTAINNVPPTMEVKYLDKMPVIAPPPALPKPLPKPVPVEKHTAPPKSHKAGLSPVKQATAARHVDAPPAHHTFISKISIPKFVPHEMDDQPIAASPSPGISAPAPHPMMRSTAPVLKSKTRGVLSSDVNFQLSDRGSLATGETAVAIPVGEERGDTAVLPAGTMLHEAPAGVHAVQGYRYKPGNGVGSGDLVGRNKGYHGMVKADSYIEGSDDANMAAAEKVAHTSASGSGFDIGGPVGDRKILHQKLPEYPDWAEEKGISAMVKVYFTVRPDGTIRPSMRILRSSGYTELDQLAKEALAGWKFSPTSAESTAEDAWGVITFRFTLN